MDPITILALAGAGIIGALAAAGPIIAPIAGAAAAAGPLATLGTVVGAPLVAGSVGAGAAAGGAIANNPHAAGGVENALIDANNNFIGSVADTVNPLGIPGVHINVN